MSSSAKTAGKIDTHVGAAQPSRGDVRPRLKAAMACDTAFRIIARRSLADLAANHRATREGDPIALHRMRIALTRLRTSISFFSPMVADVQRTRIRRELKWLNGHLGRVRDIDVAFERLKPVDEKPPRAISDHRNWASKRAARHRLLAQTLQSARYGHMLNSTSDWVENGAWSIRNGKQPAKQRTAPIAEYSTFKLAGWQRKLLKKRRKLPNMDAGKRHRLRLLNKRLSYSIEFLKDLFSDKKFAGQKARLKQLRKAQKSLGRLNDEANARAMAAVLQENGGRSPLQSLDPKHEKHLLRTAEAAYRKLAALKPLQA